MNKFSRLVAFISLLSILAGTFANAQPAISKSAAKEDKSQRIPDVVILALKESATLEDDAGGKANHKFKTNSNKLDTALSSLGVQSVKPLFPRGQVKKDASNPELERIYQVKLKKNADIDAALAALSAVADVDFAEPDFFIDATQDPYPTGTPTPEAVNDPRYPEQWALTAIGAPEAWAQMPADAPSITVAVIDSGVCADHPDLQGRILAGWDFVQNDDNPQDDFGHGCSVTGIIAANMNNGIGIAGVAPNAMVVPLRVLDASGSGSYSNVASAIVYAADHDTKVINLSLGGASPSTTLENAVNYAISKGVIVVAAAGNSGAEGALYPAAYPDVIAVGSVDSDLQHSSFSNYGSQIDIWAPGRDVLTTKADGGYGLMNGTSFAAPYVAGGEVVEMPQGKRLTLNSKLLLLGNAISLAAATSVSEQTPVEPTTTNMPPDTGLWREFTDLYWAFNLSYPADWFLQSSPNRDFGWRIYSPDLKMDPLGRPLSGGYLSVNIAQPSGNSFRDEELFGATITLERQVVVSGIPAVETQGVTAYGSHFKSVYFETRGHIYVLKVVAERSATDLVFLSADKIIDSFYILADPVDYPSAALDDIQALALSFPAIKLPFPPGSGKITNGYNSGLHTGGDLYALDLIKCDGSVNNQCNQGQTGQQVIAPTNITLIWSGDYNGVSNDGNDFHIFQIASDSSQKLCMSLAHVYLSTSGTIARGTTIGTLTPYTYSFPHYHMGIWTTPLSNSCAGGNRTPVPFAGSFNLDGVDYAVGENHVGKSVASTNGSSSSLNPPTLLSPSQGQTLTSRSVHFTWQSPNATNQNGYTFRLSASSNPDTQPWLKDTGLGNEYTSYDYTFNADGTYYWHMRTWNTSNQASGWETRSFSINTSSGGGNTPPAGFTWCADEDGYCGFSGTADVVYGALSSFTSPRSFANGTNCNNNVFGDPISGTRKACYYKLTSPPPSGNLHVEYFNDKNLGGRCYDGYENSVYIFKNWGNGAPASGCNSDNFSARFTGTYNFPGGNYSFHCQHDDGCRIYIDGQLKLDAWWDSSFSGHDTAVTLSGSHQVKVEFYDSGGEARLEAFWSGAGFLPTGPSCTTGEWCGQYYGNKTLSGAPAVQRNEGNTNINYVWNDGGIGFGFPNDNFSARWERKIYFPAGRYRFHIRTDDGGRLWVNNNLVIDQWKDQGVTEYTVDLELGAGEIPVKFEYYEGGGGAIAQMWWDTLQVYPLPSAEFDAWPQSGSAPFTSTMHIVNTSNITSCLWNYGDGQTGNSCASTHDHVYASAGTYTVSLTVSGPGGTNSMTRTNYITVSLPVTYTLTVSKSGTGSGAVTSSPSGINCGSDCSKTYNYNTNVTLTATPAAGSTFTGWSGACTGTGNCVVSMTAAKSVTANFTLNSYSLTVSKTGTGSGTVTSSPTGINCGSDCSEAYNYNTSVTLTATQSAGSSFAGWSGACTGTGTCTITMSAAQSVTASFYLLPATPTLVSPLEGTTLSRTNNTVLNWNTTGATCTVHVWGGNIDISPRGSCGSLTLGAQRGGAYSWQVTAENDYGSSTGPVWRFNVKPYAPTGLFGSAASSTQVNLSWTLSSDEPSDVDSYDIYKNGVLLANVPKGTANYLATGLACNTSYSFYMRSKRQGVQSDDSNVINVTPPCPPTVSISSTTANLTNVSPIPVTVAFSSSVTGFTASDVVTGNGSVGNFAGSGTNYTFDLTPAGDGLVTVNIPAGAAQDSVGNNNLAAPQFSRTYDGTVPTVFISSATTAQTKNSPIPVTVTFSEIVTGFTASDIAASNGTVSNFSGSGANYTFNLTPSANGPVTADIASGAAQDLAGNSNTAASQFSRIYDTVAPTVSMQSTAASRTNASPIPVTVTFSEIVTGFTASDITASNGTVSNFGGSGASYTFDLIPTANGLVTANIAAGMAQDNAGNNNTAATQFSRTYDTIAPTVVINSTTTNPTNASPIAVAVTFSESVTGFTESDVTVSNGTIGNFTGSGANYTFSVTPLSEDLITIDVAGGAAQDLAGNNNAAAPQFSRVYDGTAPTVSMSSATTDPTNATPIPVSVTFSENVTGFTASDIAVSNGTVGNFAGSGANYTFNLIPTASGLVTANIAANKALDSAGNNNSAAAQFSRVYDGTAPTISFNSTAPNSTNAYPIPVTVTFSESVTGFEEDDLVVTNSVINNFTGSGASYTFDLIPAADGLVTVNIGAGAAQDWVGNNNTAAAQFSRMYDTVAPVTAITGKPASLDNDSTPTFTFIGDDGAGSGTGSYVCKMDDGDYAVCPTPFTSPVLSDGPHTFYVKAIDRASNEDTTPDSYTWALDTVKPVVASINLVNAGAPNLASIDFVVAFSEPVVGVDTKDFKLTNTLLTGASTTAVTRTSDSEYTVTVNTGTGDGTIRLDIAATAVIKDFAGNTVAAPYSGNAIYTVQKGAAPTVPLLVAPAANALVSASPTLDWSNSSEVMALANPWSYEVNITAPDGYNHTFSTASGLENSSLSDFSEAPLSPNTTYTWKVRAYNGTNQYSAWSLTRTFRTKLATPVLISPADAVAPALNNKRPTFIWGGVSGAASYTIQLLKFGAPVSTVTLSGTTYTPTTDLLPDTPYTWKVKANGVNAGDYSAPFTFTTSVNPPMPPILTLPAGGTVVDSSVEQKLKWNPVAEVNTTSALTTYPAAASFEVEYALNSAFTDSTAAVVNGNSLVNTELVLPASALLASRTYYWRVRSWSGADASGNHSAWSLAWTFRTAMPGTKLPAPALVSPLDGVTLDSKRPTFIWNEVPGAASYTLQVLKGTAIVKTVTVAVPQHSYAYTTDLLPNTAYTWQVKANGLASSDFSVPRTFTTSLNAPQVPVLSAPAANGLVDSAAPVTLDWNPALAVNTTNPATTFPAAVSYDVEYATNSAFTGSTLVNVPEDKYDFPNDLLSARTMYYWRVRSVNATGQVSLWSAARIFKTRVATTTLNVPVNGAMLDNKRPVFEWDAVDGATSYTLQILKRNPVTNLFTVVVHTGTILAPRYTYAPTIDLLPSTEYAWQVKANHAVYPGVYSAQSTFTTSVNPPKAPVQSLPATGILIASNMDATLVWLAPLPVVNANPALAYPSAASYDVQVSTNAQFANVNSNDNTKVLNVAGSTSTTLFEVLRTGTAPDNVIRPGRTYYWRVRSVSADGNHSAWSATRTILVKFATPLLTSVTDSLPPGKPTFRWNSNDNGLWTNYTITVVNAATNAVVRTYTVPAPLTTYTIPASLPRLPAGTYKWKVKINGLYAAVESALSSEFIVAP